MLYTTADAHGARAAISLGHVGDGSDAIGFAHSRLCTVPVSNVEQRVSSVGARPRTQ
jgi:hypothetical protein